MARIAVAHVDPGMKGGGEGVCVATLEALQADHDLTLFTLAEPDVGELNDYFQTDVDDIRVRTPAFVESFLDWLDDPRYNLRNALLNRFVARERERFDLAFGTDNELGVANPLVQYVHTPRFARLVVSKRVGEDGFVDHAYDRFSWKVGGFDPDRIRESTVLANSGWIADVVQDAYGVRPDVVHPPVDTRGFAERGDRPFGEREPGFVTVGRLARYKNVLENVEIIDRVRERGHNVHIHLVGPGYDDEYTREVKRAAGEREYVRVEGEVSREELVDIVARHRYGLHGKRHEHFGMAVAELVAGGTVPFVPDNGGQREIVGSDRLTYSTTDEAVEQIDRVLSNPEEARELRRGTAEIERQYGRERFKREIRDVVDDALA